jgi:mono/diheme cytochrome c family protein
MRKLAFGMTAALALGTIAAARFGGWAVVKVQNAPDYLVVGKAATFDFAVRQHGVEELRGLDAKISARSGLRTVNGKVSESAGRYRGTLTVPSAGEWKVTIESGFGNAKGRLLPKRAINAGEPAPVITETERGRQLFASAGCVTCHVHRAVGIDPILKNSAPELSDKRFAADYLARFLADPSIKPQAPGMGQMPNLRLREPEIAALVAFINAERTVSSR